MVELFAPRRVPLGGLRAMMVNRLLPQRALPTVGAWCFIDQFGPENTDMQVLPHPHTGLQTVTWPFAGRVRHRDSIGNNVVIEPGQLDLMTSGRGIAHSEFSLGERPVLHGLHHQPFYVLGRTGRQWHFRKFILGGLFLAQSAGHFGIGAGKLVLGLDQEEPGLGYVHRGELDIEIRAELVLGEGTHLGQY